MDPVRLRPSVEPPIRRTRPLAMGVALALLFAFGARNYVASMHRCPYATATPRTMVRLDLVTEPAGASVIRERDARTLCVTPCALGVEAEPAIVGYRFELPGYEIRRVAVNLAGGDTH